MLYPRDGNDLARIARLAAEPRFRGIRLVPRGGGTNGQSLTSGAVVDASRHMNRILAIDPAARRLRVEAGAVKDQLNAALRPYGLFFAPSNPGPNGLSRDCKAFWSSSMKPRSQRMS